MLGFEMLGPRVQPAVMAGLRSVVACMVRVLSIDSKHCGGMCDHGRLKAVLAPEGVTLCCCKHFARRAAATGMQHLRRPQPTPWSAPVYLVHWGNSIMGSTVQLRRRRSTQWIQELKYKYHTSIDVPICEAGQNSCANRASPYLRTSLQGTLTF